MKRYYILDRKDVRKVCEVSDMEKWNEWMESGSRIFNKTFIENFEVSTVFLGYDHTGNSYDENNYDPEISETIIFGGETDTGYLTRCSTWNEAEDQHHKAVVGLKTYGEDFLKKCYD